MLNGHVLRQSAITRLLNRVPGDTWTSMALIAGFVLAAVIAGYIIGSGSIVKTALVGGAVLSVVLLTLPAATVWLVLIGVFLISGPLIFNVPGMDKIGWLFSVLGIFLLIASILYGTLDRPKRVYHVPGFIWVMVLFLVLGIASTKWLIDPANFAFSGIKRYYQYFGVMMALAFIPFSIATVWRWMVFLMALCAVQLPYVAWQRFVLIPRTGWTLDAVVGTMEATMNGHGSSGSLAFLATCAFAGLMSAHREGFIGIGRLAGLSILILAPLFLADVNVFWIMLPLAFFLVYSDLVRRKPLMFLTIAASGMMAVIAIAAAVVLYQQAKTTDRADQSLSFQQDIDRLIQYNFGEQGYTGQRDVNRTTVYRFWWQENARQGPAAIVFGHGLGSLSENEQGPRPRLRTLYGNMSIGLTVAALILWETGLLGLTLFVSALVLAWIKLYRLQSVLTSGRLKVLTKTALVAHSCNFVYLIYTNSMMWVATQNLLLALTLGMIVWLDRQASGLKPPRKHRARDQAAAAAPSDLLTKTLVTPV